MKPFQTLSFIEQNFTSIELTPTCWYLITLSNKVLTFALSYIKLTCHDNFLFLFIVYVDIF